MGNTYEGIGNGALVARIVARMSTLSVAELQGFITYARSLGFDPSESMYHGPGQKSTERGQAFRDLVQRPT